MAGSYFGRLSHCRKSFSHHFLRFTLNVLLPFRQTVNQLTGQVHRKKIKNCIALHAGDKNKQKKKELKRTIDGGRPQPPASLCRGKTCGALIAL